MTLFLRVSVLDIFCQNDFSNQFLLKMPYHMDYTCLILLSKWTRPKMDNSPVQVVVSRHLMRNLLTFSTKKSHMSWYLKSSLLTSLHRFMYRNARRLLMSDLFVKKVSMFLMSRHLMSSHLKKKMRWLLMRCLLTTAWTGLMFFSVL